MQKAVDMAENGNTSMVLVVSALGDWDCLLRLFYYLGGSRAIPLEKSVLVFCDSFH